MELERSVKYLSANFAEASNKYNELVDILAVQDRVVNDTLHNHTIQVCWTMQRLA
jgi:hypothetical protein